MEEHTPPFGEAGADLDVQLVAARGAGFDLVEQFIELCRIGRAGMPQTYIRTRPGCSGEKFSSSRESVL